jgi:hypothetical protein
MRDPELAGLLNKAGTCFLHETSLSTASVPGESPGARVEDMEGIHVEQLAHNGLQGQGGALMIRPPTKRPNNIWTRMVRPPNVSSVLTFYYCHILTL